METDDWKMLGVTFASVFVLFGVVGGLAMWLNATSCHARWSQADRITQWGFFSGCLVQSEGKFVPEKRIWYERNR